jgi:hypothetical protein
MRKLIAAMKVSLDENVLGELRIGSMPDESA